jgi:prophage regulatory protein
MEQHKNRILRMPELVRLVGVSRSTLFRWIRAGHFPPPLVLGPRAVGWPASQVSGWLLSRPRGLRGPRGEAGAR